MKYEYLNRDFSVISAALLVASYGYKLNTTITGFFFVNLDFDVNSGTGMYFTFSSAPFLFSRLFYFASNLPPVKYTLRPFQSDMPIVK